MKKYRVEAFIVPSINKNAGDSNQIDDVKLAIKLNNQSVSSVEENIDEVDEKDTHENPSEQKQNTEDNEEIDKQSLSGLSEVFFEINEHIYDEIKVPDVKKVDVKKEELKTTEYSKAFIKIGEPIYDEPFVGNLSSFNSKNICNEYDVPQTKWSLANSKYRRFGIVAPKVPKRSSSLKSIVEDFESFEDTLQEICCHGGKNTYQPPNQRPEDISEEIFRENWMQKLGSLRKLETLLKDKEVALQSRERLLFKKEKELRILERLVKDKMKQAELYANRCKKSFSAGNILLNERESESRSSGDSKFQALPTAMSNLPNIDRRLGHELTLHGRREKFPKNPPNSISSVAMDRLSNRIGSMRSRSRPRNKIKYDDLDSSLSADIGDSSIIVTSQKFDPGIFKKPTAFIRSASERRPRVGQDVIRGKLKSVPEVIEFSMDVGNLEDKTLEKISKNILASQDHGTKYLNYGLIDETKPLSKSESIQQKRVSYLNLESVNTVINPKSTNNQRPISWNEDSDDWLRKKREAYNLATKKVNELKTEKENCEKQTKMNADAKGIKKKDSKKKFSIFR